MNNQNYSIVSNWLIVICFLIFAIVIVGGATRLTRSGLSIVEWKVVTGVLPPMNQSQWQDEFIKYKQYPEYKKINREMNLDEFKGIYYWEYVHRLLGRFIGIAFLLPFLFFWIRGDLKGLSIFPFVIMFVLGGLQGLLGWFMVKSGLVDLPYVSHYRLASHLLLAFGVYSYILYYAIFLRKKTDYPEEKLFNKRLHNLPKDQGVFLFIVVIFLLLVLQIFYGALVAGLKAGFIANTFPDMDGVLVPWRVFTKNPLWMSLFEIPFTVQFIHRTLAWVLVLAVIIFVFWARKSSSSGKSLLTLLVFTLLFQFILGVLTLLYHVPVILGVLHQAGALLLLTVFIFLFYDINHAPNTRY